MPRRKRRRRQVPYVPLDVLGIVMQFARPYALRKARLVCRTWNAAVMATNRCFGDCTPEELERALVLPPRMRFNCVKSLLRNGAQVSFCHLSNARYQELDARLRLLMLYASPTLQRTFAMLYSYLMSEKMASEFESYLGEG